MSRALFAEFRKVIEATIDALPACCERTGWTYLVRGAGLIKIGMSIDRLAYRLIKVQASSPVPLELVAVARGTGLENRLHSLLFEHRAHGEWFLAPESLGSLHLVFRCAKERRICLHCALEADR